MYPYDFALSIEGQLDTDGSFMISQIVENKEADKPLPIAMGLHPYFKVPDEEKKNIRFDFKGGDYIEKNIDVWANGGTISIDNPKVGDPSATMEIIIPELGVLILDISIEYKKVWIWSQPGQDFICIEPVMRDVGGLADDPVFIKPLQLCAATMRVSIKK
jgi:galactose mutarotase-like enzyme